MRRAGRPGMAALAVALACACGGKGGAPVTGGGSADPARSCEDLRPKVERLYRVEAEAKEPRRVEEAVADNTAMVMNDCARAPGKVAPCVSRASSIAEIEKQCLVPLDDEGTEGEELKP